MKFKPRRSEEPEINVVSLIDVVLLLVVFFMLSSKFTTEGRLHIRLPQASTLPVQRAAEEGLVVTVSASGSYLVNARELVNSSADTLRSAILKTVGNGSRTAPVCRCSTSPTARESASSASGRSGNSSAAICSSPRARSKPPRGG